MLASGVNKRTLVSGHVLGLMLHFGTCMIELWTVWVRVLLIMFRVGIVKWATIWKTILQKWCKDCQPKPWSHERILTIVKTYQKKHRSRLYWSSKSSTNNWKKNYRTFLNVTNLTSTHSCDSPIFFYLVINVSYQLT